MLTIWQQEGCHDLAWTRDRGNLRHGVHGSVRQRRRLCGHGSKSSHLRADISRPHVPAVQLRPLRAVQDEERRARLFMDAMRAMGTVTLAS